MNSAGESGEKSSFWLWDLMLQQHSCDMLPPRAAACTIHHLSSNPLACFMSIGGESSMNRDGEAMHTNESSMAPDRVQFVGRVRTRYSG